jgi:hypothetical protein
MYLIPVSALADSYLCLPHGSKHALVVDPAHARVSRTLRNQHGLDLESILVTHPHTGRVMPSNLKNRAACTRKYISTRPRCGVPASPIITLWQPIAASNNKFSPDHPTVLTALAETCQ